MEHCSGRAQVGMRLCPDRSVSYGVGGRWVPPDGNTKEADMGTTTTATISAQQRQAGEERPVAEQPAVSACCGASEQATCCAPAAKASCCGTPAAGAAPSGGCGCR